VFRNEKCKTRIYRDCVFDQNDALQIKYNRSVGNNIFLSFV
jgi:hypothetical protein